MNETAQIVRQHLINPETCIRCGACERVCPSRAISHDMRNMAIDFSLCNGSGKCIVECSTGAINAYREVPPGATYSVAEQYGWTELPPA